MVWVFLAGMVVGTILGVFLMCLMNVSGRASDMEERDEYDKS